MMGSFVDLTILSTADANLRHLELEMARIDLLIQQAVQRWQQAGQDPADKFRGLYLSIDEASALAQHPLGNNWGTGIQLTADEENRAITAQPTSTASGLRARITSFCQS